MSNLWLILLGVLISILGCLNIKGDIRSIHWYNRRKVTPENAPKYGRAVGSGTLIIGLSLMLTALLEMLLYTESVYYITLVGIVVGLVLILYGQWKYNHGIF